MGKRELGGGLVAITAMVAAWLLPVTFPNLSGTELAIIWALTGLAFLCGFWLSFHTPKRKTVKWTDRSFKGLESAFSKAAEDKERSAILGRITDLYMLSHRGISNEMMAGIEFAPADFLNGELERMGATWRVRQSGTLADTYDL